MQQQQPSDTQIEIDNAAMPGLLRRLAAIFYDSWLVAAFWLLGAMIDTFVRSGLELGNTGYHLPLQLYLLLAPTAFFSWFWMHGGQTLGMRAWRMKLLRQDGGKVSLKQALIRCAGALLSILALGLGYLWVLIDQDKLSWHDRLSGTRLVMTEKTE